jgi:hypothetical protein
MELNKKQTAERLGVTTRAVERYMSVDRPSDSRLVPVRYQQGRGGQQPIFDSEQVDAFKRKMEQAAQVKRDKPEETQLARIPAQSSALQSLALALSEGLAKASNQVVPVGSKIFLTIRESSQLSGLSQKEIRAAVKDGSLKSRRGARGAIVLHREDLEKWARGT